MHPVFRASCLTASLMLGLFLATSAKAAVTVTAYRQHQTAATAYRLGALSDSVVVFGQLQGGGDARFVTFTVAKPTHVDVEVGTSLDTSTLFSPQIVLFIPDRTTTGPLLPIPQPANTTALVYRADTQNRVLESATQTEYLNRLQSRIDLSTAGTYILAVYNTDGHAGRFRLTMIPSGAPLTSMSTWPRQWWQAQAWAGLSVRTLFAPLVLIAVVAVAWWLVKVRQQAMVKVAVKK